MRDQTLCSIWARIPGLNDYTCLQLQWRIGLDDDVIDALTEPRYPVPDESLDTIVLVQTIYLCQLFLHLQEFDPVVCLSDDDQNADEQAYTELVRIFQDALAREFNNISCFSGVHARNDGPAPDGEMLERVVRGLMKAQRDEDSAHPPQQATPSTRPSTSPTQVSSNAQLRQLLVRILAELNGPVYKHPLRYEAAHGARSDDTWAARYATRVMQWRWSLRKALHALREEVIGVNTHDVCPLDQEGLDVYRIVRNSAPGHIHVVTPLQPSMQQAPRGEDAGVNNNHHQTQHRPSISTGSAAGRMHGNNPALPLPRTPSEPPTTPRKQSFSSQQNQGPSAGAEASTTKRDSEPHDQTLPPPKRPRPLQRLWDAGRETAVGDMPIRSTGLEVQRDARAADETNMLLVRVLDGINGLGHKMDGMQQDLGQRFTKMEERLSRIEDWLTDPV